MAAITDKIKEQTRARIGAAVESVPDAPPLACAAFMIVNKDGKAENAAPFIVTGKTSDPVLMEARQGPSARMKLTEEEGLTLYADPTNYISIRHFALGITNIHSYGIMAQVNFNSPITVGYMAKADRNAMVMPGNGMLIYQTDATPGLRIYLEGAWHKFTTTADP